DEENDVRAMCPGLVDLVRVDGEVLAQQRDIHVRTHRVEVGQGAVEAALLGQAANDGRTVLGIGLSQYLRLRDGGQGALRRARALDLGDDAHRSEERRVGQQR